MKKNKLSVLSIILMFLCLYSTAEVITFKANSMKGNTSEQNEYTLLSGSAYIKTDDMEIFADEIEMTGKDFRFITARGSIKGKNLTSNFDFTCETMKFDRDTKIAVLEGDVFLDDIDNEVKAKAQIIEYNQDTEIAVMQVKVELISKDSVCTSSIAVYNKENQLVTLTGNPKIVRKDDIFRAQEILLNIDTEEITLDGKVRGTVVDSDKEEKSETKGNTPADKPAANTTQDEKISR